jgi:hypothetical protein
MALAGDASRTATSTLHRTCEKMLCRCNFACAQEQGRRVVAGRRAVRVCVTCARTWACTPQESACAGRVHTRPRARCMAWPRAPGGPAGHPLTAPCNAEPPTLPPCTLHNSIVSSSDPGAEANGITGGAEARKRSVPWVIRCGRDRTGGRAPRRVRLTAAGPQRVCTRQGLGDWGVEFPVRGVDAAARTFVRWEHALGGGHVSGAGQPKRRVGPRGGGREGACAPRRREGGGKKNGRSAPARRTPAPRRRRVLRLSGTPPLQGLAGFCCASRQ